MRGSVSGLVLGLSLVLSASASALTWEGFFIKHGYATSPYGAQVAAKKAGLKSLGALTKICDAQGGKAKYYQVSDNKSCILGSGPEDFQCPAATVVSCELGEVEFVSDSELDGFYYEEKSKAFVQIKNGEATHSILAPYYNSTLFKTLGPLVRTGESTYLREGRFMSALDECEATAKLTFTKVSNGNLLVQATSPARVRAVIFGACRWAGEANQYYELKKVKFIQK